MAEGPIADFINKLSVERKPLTVAERGEALKVGGELWKKGMQYIVDGPASAGRGLEDDVCETYISILNPQKTDGFKKELLQCRDTADLVISLIRTDRDPLTRRTSTTKVCNIDMYEFSPGKITKLERRNVPLVGADQYEMVGDKLMASPIVSKDAVKVREQETRERYEPNKEELQELLGTLDSSRQISYLLRHRRYPA